MSYCTNCGKRTLRRICPECGVKRNDTHKFCEWCGEALNENASVCTNCKEKTKPSKGILKTILGILLIGETTVVESNVIRVLCVIVGISLLPFVNRIIIEITKGKKVLRFTGTMMAIVLLFVAAFHTPSTVTDFEATKAAEAVFHKNYQLKNEDSYVLNNSLVVTADEPFNDDENLVLVTVTLDVSAENSFGGTVREDYTIELLYNHESRKYYEYSPTGKIQEIF